MSNVAKEWDPVKRGRLKARWITEEMALILLISGNLYLFFLFFPWAQALSTHIPPLSFSLFALYNFFVEIVPQSPVQVEQ